MTGAILAGGQSRRMGFNKALIEIGGQTLVERIVSLFSAEFDDVLIAAVDLSPYENLGVRAVTDVIKGAGSLGGVYTALKHANSEYVFVAACDMPRLDRGAIKRVCEAADDADVVVPYIASRLHPMHALYSKRCIEPIEALIEAGELRLGALIDKVRTLRLTEEDFDGLPIAASIENINTTEDLARLTEAGGGGD